MTTLAAPQPAVDRFAHQEGALAFIARRPGVLLDAGMSAGKTAICLRAAETMNAQRVLVVCPRNVLGVWPREVRKHSTREWLAWNGEVRGARGPLANPSVARRAEAIVQATHDAIVLHRPLMIVVNYDACWRGDMARVLLGTNWDLLVLDECHRIKAPGGKASMLLKQIGARTRARGGKVIGGSGTPTPHDELDLYAQLRAIDPVLGTSFARVKARYGAPKVRWTYPDGTPEYLLDAKGQPVVEGLRKDRRNEFAGIVGRVIYRISQEEIDRNLGLEEPVDLYRTTTLEPATRRVYDALERDQIAEVAGGVITAANAMVSVLRLAQAANGFGSDADNPDVVHRLADPPEKARLLADVLEDLPAGQPVVVFCRFHHDLDAVAVVAGQAGRRYGELSGRRRDGLTADSEMAPDIDLLGVQIQSGGTGIDLTRASIGIYYSLDFNLADYLQSRKRLHRHGQQHVVTFVHLLAEDTVDRAIYGALRKREDTLRAFLNYMKEQAP